MLKFNVSFIYLFEISLSFTSNYFMNKNNNNNNNNNNFH